MTPVVADGTIPASPQSTPSAIVDIGQPGCTTVYSGDAPGLVEGIVQYDCQVVGTPYRFGFEASPPDRATYASPEYYTVYKK